MGSNNKAAATVLASLALCGLFVLGFLMGAHPASAAAVGCDAAALSPCVGAIMMGGPVSTACCARLRAQQACLCQYARDPSYRVYVNSPKAQGVAKACGLPKPKC